MPTSVLVLTVVKQTPSNAGRPRATPVAGIDSVITGRCGDQAPVGSAEVGVVPAEHRAVDVGGRGGGEAGAGVVEERVVDAGHGEDLVGQPGGGERGCRGSPGRR